MKREVTRLRSKACRWDDFRPRCRYLRAPPAIVRGLWLMVGWGGEPPGHDSGGDADDFVRY